MARLSKHGTELLRIEKERGETPEDTLCTWERRTRAYMADGTVLQKMDVRFKPDSMDPKGRFYSYGWKVAGQVKSDRTPQQAVKNITAAITEGRSKWTIVSGGPAPVVLSLKRIMAACESGDSIGFCQACGAEADGCEPDARNYTCESCGAREVYGAEELLIQMA